MKEHTLPHFPLWTHDWLCSPTTRLMSPTGRSVYMDLLCYAWDSNPVATLPADEKLIYHLSGVGHEEWESVKNQVLENFETDDEFPNRLVNHKLREQYEKAVAFRNKQAENGRKGGRPHKNTQSITQTKPNAEPRPKAKKSLSLSLSDSNNCMNECAGVGVGTETRAAFEIDEDLK